MALDTLDAPRQAHGPHETCPDELFDDEARGHLRRGGGGAHRWRPVDPGGVVAGWTVRPADELQP
jgi:hypothetical protein